MRKGSAESSRGINWFIDELAGVLRQAEATGTKTVCADSGCWSWELLRTLDRHRMSWSITVTNNHKINATIASIADDASTPSKQTASTVNQLWSNSPSES